MFLIKLTWQARAWWWCTPRLCEVVLLLRLPLLLLLILLMSFVRDGRFCLQNFDMRTRAGCEYSSNSSLWYACLSAYLRACLLRACLLRGGRCCRSLLVLLYPHGFATRLFYIYSCTGIVCMSSVPKPFTVIINSLTSGTTAGTPAGPEFHPHSLTHNLPTCLLYTSPSPRDGLLSRMPSSA